MAWADAMFFHAWGKADSKEDPELRERWSHVQGTATFFLEVVSGKHELPWDKILSGEVHPPFSLSLVMHWPRWC